MDNTRTITEINEARKGAISPESENQGASSNPVQVHLKKDNLHLLYSFNCTILKKLQKAFFIFSPKLVQLRQNQHLDDLTLMC